MVEIRGQTERAIIFSMLTQVPFVDLQQFHSFIIKLGCNKHHYISSALPASLSPCINGIDAETSTAKENPNLPVISE